MEVKNKNLAVSLAAWIQIYILSGERYFKQPRAAPPEDCFMRYTSFVCIRVRNRPHLIFNISNPPDFYIIYTHT